MHNLEACDSVLHALQMRHLVPGQPETDAPMNIKIVYLAVLAAITSGRLSAAEIEHWTCGDSSRKTVWTIAENRMFAAKGKGSLQVASNSPSMTVAYDLHRSSDNKPISYVYVLDKVGRRLVIYDDVTAVAFNGNTDNRLSQTSLRTSAKA